MRHYTDRIEATDGGLAMPVQSEHPLLQFTAGLLLSAMVASGCAWFLWRRR